MSRCSEILASLPGVITAGALAVCLASPAAADPYDATLTRAVAAKERALEVNDPTHWEEALRLFSEADAIRSTRESKYEVAYAAAQLRQNDQAVEAYEASLELGLGGSAAAKAHAFLQAHAAEMARLDVRGPAGSRVRVRGLERATLPLARPIVAFAGPASIEVILPDGVRRERELALRPGETILVPMDGAKPARAPVLPVPSSEAPAPVNHAPMPLAVAQKPLALSPGPGPVRSPTKRRTGAALTAGGVTFALISAGFLPMSTERLVRAREELRRACAVQASGPDSCAHAVRGLQPEAQSASNSIATWKAARSTAWAGLGVGLVAAATGVVLLTQAPKGEPRPGWQAAMALGPNAAELKWAVRF